MLTIHYSGRKITISPDTYEELQAVRKVVTSMEKENTVKVFDKEDFLVVFVTDKKMMVLEVICDIKTCVEKMV